MRMQTRNPRRRSRRPPPWSAAHGQSNAPSSRSIATADTTSALTLALPPHPDSALLSALLEHLEYLPLKVFIKDSTGRYLACNSAFAHHFGLSTEQIRGRTDQELYGADKAARIQREDQSLLALEEAQQAYVTTWRNGIEKLVHVTKRPWRDHQGKIGGLIGSLRNITAQKRAELKLRELAYEAEELYQRAPCGYQTLDGQNRILRINDTLLSWLGYRRSEVLETPWLDYLTLESQAGWKNYRQQLENINELQSVSLELRNKQGEKQAVLLNARANLDSLGRYLGAELMLQPVAPLCSSRLLTAQPPQHYLMELAELAAHFEQLQRQLQAPWPSQAPRRAAIERRSRLGRRQPASIPWQREERRVGSPCRRVASQHL